MRLILVFLISICISFASFGQTSNNNFQNALNFYNNRNYENSIAILEAMNIKPSDIEAYILLIDNYIKLKNYSMAETLIKDAENYHSKDFRILERKLNVELLNNRNSEARNTIKLIKALDSKNYFANYGEGVLNERIGYYKTAMTLYERAIIIDKSRAEAPVSLAYLQLANGNSNYAFNLLNNNINNNPRMAESYYHLANYYYLNKNYNNALSEISNAFYYYTNYNEAKILQASIFLSMKRYNESIGILEYIPDSEFKNNSKYYYIGNVYEEAKNYPNAKNSYINYLRVKPEDELGRLAYERVLLNTNPKPDYERNRAALYYGNMASYYTRLADNVRAQAYLKHMLKLNPANTYARLMLSDVYRRMGLEERALEELEIAKNVNPNDKSIVYKYDSYKRKLDKNIPSKSWGIENQYNLEKSGYTIAITDTINAQKDSPMFFNTALYQTLSYVLPQYGKFKVLDIHTNYYSERDLYLELNSRKVDYYLRGSTFENNIDNFAVMLDLVDVKNERVVTNFTITTKGKDRIMNAAVMTGKVIDNAIPFYCKVIKIHNDNIYINAGKLQGLTNNMNLFIYNTSSASVDLSNRNADMSIGMVKIITADENVSLTKLIDGRVLSKVNINQIVIPYITNTAANSIQAQN